MSETTPADALAMLVCALDEMRETTSLLPVAELSRSNERSLVRRIFFAFARSRAEVGAGLAVQYLPENLGRARRHWQDALAQLDELQHEHGDNEVVTRLGQQLQTAGIDGVLAGLADDALPHPIAKTGAHLARVVAKIRDCEQVATMARSTLTLQRLRNQT